METSVLYKGGNLVGKETPNTPASGEREGAWGYGTYPQSTFFRVLQGSLPLWLPVVCITVELFF